MIRLLFKISLLLFLVFTFVNLQAQNSGFDLKGEIIDAETEEPIAGATISLKNSDRQTVSDDDGRFVFSDFSPKDSITVNYLGYESFSQEVTESPIYIRLLPSSGLLEDVVVIGYGSVRKKDVTTAISSIPLDNIDQRPVVSTAQAIQGKAAGVSVIQPNGAPGGETSIRIRGTTSFNGSNDPLYVVDDVPVDNINFLSPSDIADIQILKDASSAAIYGSRAANGVVLITTKKGKSGQARIDFKSHFTQNYVQNKIKPLNTQQYAELQEEIGIVSLPDGLEDQTDWFKAAYQTGKMQDNQVSISDGTDKLKYHLSAGYINEKGVLDAAFFKRYNVRANIENKIRDWLDVHAHVSYSDNVNNGITTGTGSNRGGVVLSVVNTPMYAPIWDPEKPGQYYNNFYGISNITNPLENMERSKNSRNHENRLLASGSAAIKFSPTVKFKTMLAVDRRNGINTSFLDPITTSWGRNQYGEASDSRNMNTVITFDNVLNYEKSFGLNQIEAMLGSSWTDSEYKNNYIDGSHFRDGSIQTLNAANKISWTGTGSGASTWGIMSYFGRVSYNYESKYLITGNIRADGSSKLHPKHRWGYFPSVSAAWRLSSEPFMEDVSWIHDLKIRGGWGEAGNQSGIGDYAYLQRYSISRIEWFEEGQENAVPVINQSNLRTPDLRWETTQQSNIGIDLSAFENRLNINVDYYYKRTKDMLMNVSLPPGTAAANSIERNEGVMTNKGVEFNINSENIKGTLDWSTDFNISFNRNKLESLDLQKIYYTAKTVDFVDDYVVRNEPGRPMGSFFGYISDGVDPETGELLYRDLNDDGKISSSDRTYIGDPNPKFTFGLTNNFFYKGFNLNVFLQGSYGNDIFNASRMETEGMYNGQNQSTRVLDRWRVPGQIKEVPKAGFDMKNSTYFVEDGSYLRVKNVSLSYDVDIESIRNIGINKIQPFISLNNILTFTKYKGIDPEVNQWGNSGAVQGIDWGTYPHSKSFVLGINIGL